MPETFLGMPIPKMQPPPALKKRKTTTREWAVLALFSFVLVGCMQLNQEPLVGQRVFSEPTQSIRILSSTSSKVPVAAPLPSAAVPATVTQCDVSKPPLSVTFNVKTIFPLLPLSILGEHDICSPPYWNLDVIKIFIYKAMALLNYLILVAAIILTIYAGIMYLTGFQNEGNIKKAKGILGATYVGLIISLSATLILRTTISIAASSESQHVINDNNSAIFSGGDAKTTP